MYSSMEMRRRCGRGGGASGGRRGARGARGGGVGMGNYNNKPWERIGIKYLVYHWQSSTTFDGSEANVGDRVADAAKAFLPADGRKGK